MKKICVVTTVSKTMDWFLVDTMRYLNKHGFEITLSCNMDSSFIERNKDYAKFAPLELKRGIYPLGVIRSTYQLYKLFKIERYDIVQYSTPIAALCASIAGKLSKTPVRLYSQWGLRYVGFTGIKRKIFKLLEKLVCSLSTEIQPDSFGNLRYCIDEKLYKESKATVIWNGSATGINFTKFDISKKSLWGEEIRNHFNIDKDSFVIGFVGRVTRDKGINELLLSFQELKNYISDFYLLIIGDDEEIHTLDPQLLAWSKIEKNIIYCGNVDEVERYLSSLDVFVLPSYREGFGSVVIEAEAMGVPVIVTNIPGPREAMINNITGLVIDRYSTEDLVKALELLYRDRNMASTMGINGRKFVENNFDQKILFEKILENRKRLT